MSLEISKARARIPRSTLCARRQKINAFSWEIEPLCPTWFCLLAAVHLCHLINFSLSLYFNTFEDTAFKHDLILLYRYGIDPSDVTFEQFPKDLIRVATLTPHTGPTRHFHFSRIYFITYSIQKRKHSYANSTFRNKFLSYLLTSKKNKISDDEPHYLSAVSISFTIPHHHYDDHWGLRFKGRY